MICSYIYGPELLCITTRSFQYHDQFLHKVSLFNKLEQINNFTIIRRYLGLGSPRSSLPLHTGNIKFLRINISPGLFNLNYTLLIKQIEDDFKHHSEE